MQKYGEEKWGQLGHCIYLRMTPKYFEENYGVKPTLRFYTAENAGKELSGSWGVPVQFAEDVEGNYEAVCEFGIEIH